MAATSAQIEQQLSITATYSLITGAAVLTDATDWGLIGVATPDTAKILLQIYDPTGELFYENAGYGAGDFTSPDMSLTDATYSFTLPTDIAGDYVTGQYLIKAKVQVVEDGETTVVNKNFYQTVCACCNEIVVDVQGSNTQGTTQVKLTDYTNYRTYTALSRSMTLYPPPPSAQASQTGTNVDTIVYSGTVYTGVWTWKITSDITYTDVDGVSTTCRVTGQGTFNIQQSQLCKVRCVLEKERTRIFAQLAEKNSAILLNNYLLAMTEYQFARESQLCGSDQAVIDGHIAKAYSILGVDPKCDCGCDNGVSQPLISTTSTDGADGTDGTQILSGTTAPAGGTGAVGDFYFDTVTKYLYKKTGATTWTFQFSCEGSTGPTGASGVSILYNGILDAATTAATTWQTLDSYEMPLATLTTNGDEINFVAVFTTPNWTDPQQSTRILFNGATLLDGSFYCGFGTSDLRKIVITGRIVRTANDTANVQLYAEFYTEGFAMLQKCTQNIGALVSLNFTTTAYTIAAQGYSVVIGDVVSESLEVIYGHQS